MGDETISYGEYFTAVRRFLTQNGNRICLEALRGLNGKTVSLEELAHLSVYLAKHGEFYHPARVEMGVGGKTFPFVVNVAVSSAGLSMIRGEHQNLQSLNGTFHRNYIPRVFGLGTVPIRKGRELTLFIGEWLEGFCEFHLTGASADGERKLVVWDPDRGDYTLSGAQARQLFRQVAAIHTYYYRPGTFERITAWHHAAGDFVVRRSGKNSAMDVRLITVRRYGPLLRGVTVDAASILDALVIFFLDLSIRNRLDREDGVGATVWAGPWVVRATVEGFFEGLRRKVEDGDIPEDYPEMVHQYFSAYRPAEWSELADGVVGRYSGDAAETALIADGIPDHLDTLFQELRQLEKTPGHP